VIDEQVRTLDRVCRRRVRGKRSAADSTEEIARFRITDARLRNIDRDRAIRLIIARRISCIEHCLRDHKDAGNSRIAECAVFEAGCAVRIAGHTDVVLFTR
jgi:hypothetical protein